MKRLIFSPRATIDIDQIYDYTEKKWEVEQAEDYILGIRDHCYALADGTKCGRRINGIKRAHLALSCGSAFHNLQRQRASPHDHSYPASANEYRRSFLTPLGNALHRTSPCASR